MQNDLQSFKNKRKKINMNLISLTVVILFLGIIWQIQDAIAYPTLRDIGVFIMGLYAIIQIIGYILASKEDKYKGSYLSKTFAAVAIAIIIYNDPIGVMGYFLIFISVLFFYNAGYLLQLTFTQFKYGNKYSWLLIVLAALALGLGIYSLVNPTNPGTMFYEAIQLSGILLISLAIINIIALVLNNIGVDLSSFESDKPNHNVGFYGQYNTDR